MSKMRISIPVGVAEALRPFIYNAIDELRGKGERELSAHMDRLGNTMSSAVTEVSETDDLVQIELTILPGD